MLKGERTEEISMKLQISMVVPIFLFTVLPIFPTVVADLNSDKQALLDFAAAVSHLRKLNWSDAAAPVCSSWIGVTCNVNRSRVIGIHLPGIGFTGPVPANSIGKLDALKVLSLRSNYLTGILPSDITSISSLQFVYLQNNNFSGVLPAFRSLQLNELDLSFNSFSGSIPPGFQNLTRLHLLNLQNNSISGAIPPLNLPRLKILNFSNNNLNGSIPDSLQKFPNSSFVGNSMLCGLPLTPCSTVSSSPSPSPSYFPTISPHKNASRKKLNSGSIIAIAVGGCAVLFLLKGR